MNNEIEELVSKYSHSDIYKAIATDMGFKVCPPSIKEFIEDDEYLGEIFKGSDGTPGGKVYDYWKEVLEEIFPNPFTSPQDTILLRHAIGCGKSVAAKIGFLYNICKLLCMDDPRSYFGLLPTVEIVNFVYATDLRLGGAVVMTELNEWISMSPFFKAHRDPSNKTYFKNNINIHLGSQISHNVGKAVINALFEEINQEIRHNQLKTNYDSIKARIKSRFMTERGTLFSQVWLVGSPYGNDSFAEELTKKALDDPSCMVLSAHQWSVLGNKLKVREDGTTYYGGGKLTFKKETFDVFVGNETKEPTIITDSNKDEFLDVEESLIIKPPIDYIEDFKRDIYVAVQDIGGIATSSLHRFITQISKIKTCMINKNWFERDIVILSFYDANDTLFKKMDIERFRNRLKPEKPRFIHLDLSYSGDVTGISSVFISHFTRTERVNPATGKLVITNDPVFFVDFTVGVYKRAGEEIPLFKIKNFIMDLSDAGYKIASVSADGFQSKTIMQELLVEGFDTEYVSCDRTMEPFSITKDAFLTNRVMCVDNEVLFNEIKSLRVINNKKVDHQDGGNSFTASENGSTPYGKDLSDSLAGAIFNAYSQKDRYTLLNTFGQTSHYTLMNMSSVQLQKERELLGIHN